MIETKYVVGLLGVITKWLVIYQLQLLDKFDTMNKIISYGSNQIYTFYLRTIKMINNLDISNLYVNSDKYSLLYVNLTKFTLFVNLFYYFNPLAILK